MVYEAQAVGSAAAAVAALAAPDFDPGATVILEQAPVPPPEAAPAEAPRLTPATVTRHERHRVVVEAETPRAGVLVVSEVYYPGWRRGSTASPRRCCAPTTRSAAWPFSRGATPSR